MIHGITSRKPGRGGRGEVGNLPGDSLHSALMVNVVPNANPCLRGARAAGAGGARLEDITKV
jgi:hypothetical protein